MQSSGASPVVCIVATHGENETADMLDAALVRRGIEPFWLTPAEVLADVLHGDSDLAAKRQADVPPSSIAPEDCSLRPGSRLADADGVLLAAGNFQNYFAHVRFVFERAGQVLLNSARSSMICGDKWLAHEAFVEAGVPVADSRLAADDDALEAAIDELGYPVVVKELHGLGGAGVVLAHNASELHEVIGEVAFAEEGVKVEHYIECGGGDLRLLVVEGEVLGAFRRQAKEGDFRSNLTLGGSGEAAVASDEDRRLARQAYEALGLELMGLDVGRVTEVLPGREYLPLGSAFVFEANSTPGLTGLVWHGGVDISDQVVDVFLRKLAAASTVPA